MKTLRHPRLRFVLLSVLSVLCASCGVSKNNRYWQSVRAYQAAPPVPQQEDSGRIHWDSEVVLPSGNKVVVKACYCGPTEDSTITLRYDDETRERVVYSYADYLYPGYIRIDGSLLYAQVSGVAGGVWPRTRLIVYDLAKRKKLREIRVAPDDLN